MQNNNQLLNDLMKRNLFYPKDNYPIIIIIQLNLVFYLLSGLFQTTKAQIYVTEGSTLTISSTAYISIEENDTLYQINPSNLENEKLIIQNQDELKVALIKIEKEVPKTQPIATKKEEYLVKSKKTQPKTTPPPTFQNLEKEKTLISSKSTHPTSFLSQDPTNFISPPNPSPRIANALLNNSNEICEVIWINSKVLHNYNPLNTKLQHTYITPKKRGPPSSKYS